MKNLFSAYYKYSYLKPSSLSLTSQYGYYAPIEDDNFEPDSFDKIEFKEFALMRSNTGKFRLTNVFFGDFVGLTNLRNYPNHLIVINFNSHNKTVELFIPDKKNLEAEFSIHFSTEEQLLAEMALMRLQAFCFS